MGWPKKKKKVTNKTSKPKTGKMRAIKKVVDGVEFDSTMEANFYEHLKAEQARGVISSFTLQPEYVLQEKYQKYGKTIREIKYISDFLVNYKDGSRIVIDVKGRATVDFKLKRKMFDYKFPEESLILVIWDKYDNCWEDYDEFQKKERAIRKANKAAKEAKVS
jgi:hypothetical protein